MNEKQTHYDWFFGLQWLIACAAGIVVFGMAGFVSIWTIGEAVQGTAGEIAGMAAAGFAFGALFGLGASIGTGFLLRAKGVKWTRWIFYSVLSGALVSAMSFAVILSVLDAETMPDSVSGLLLGLTLGLSVGIGQWLVLRQTDLAAGVWPAISVAAFVPAIVAGNMLGGEGSEWISLAAMGLIVAAVSALGMTWLLRQQTAVAV